MVGNSSLTTLNGKFARYRYPNGHPAEHLLMPIPPNSCPEIRVYDFTPIRCSTASRASETLVQETMFNQVFQKLLIYAAGSGVSSGQRVETSGSFLRLRTSQAGFRGGRS
jgi:hypothetical protein